MMDLPPDYNGMRLRELLAAIHCDGGQYVAEHGEDKATEDAIAEISKRSRVLRECLRHININSLIYQIHSPVESGVKTADESITEYGDIMALMIEYGLTTKELVDELYDRLHEIDTHRSGKVL